MKRSFVLLSLLFITASLFLISCAKKNVTPAATCIITFNGNDIRTADSIHYDYYNGTTPRIQAFVGGLALITVWPSGVSSGTSALAYRYLYWIIQTPTVYTVNSTGGTITLTNTNGLISGSLSASGDVYSGTGVSPTTISASFSNVRELGH